MGVLGEDNKHAPLRKACMNEDYQLIKRLVEKEGVDVNSFDGLALRISAYHGKIKSIQALLEVGANKPRDLVKVSKKYFFIWSQRLHTKRKRKRR